MKLFARARAPFAPQPYSLQPYSLQPFFARPFALNAHGSARVLALVLVFGAALAGCTPKPAGPAAPPPPPAARTVDVADSFFGAKVPDPYRWLENGGDPEVKAWSDAQNIRTRAYLDHLASRPAIAGKLKALVTATSPSFTGLTARGQTIFAIYFDPAHQQPMLVTLSAAADPSSRKVVVDPNALDAKGSIAIDWYTPSPDGTKVAASLSANGSEDGTLHVYDVASGKEIEPAIARVQYPTAGGSLAWTADNKAFWYTRYPDQNAPEADRHFFQQVYFHKLGTPAAGDKLVLATKDGLPRTAEVFLANDGGPTALVSVQKGDGNEWQHWVLSPSGGKIKIGAYEDQVTSASIGPDGTIYGVSRRDAPNGKVLKLAAPYAGGFAKARVIVPAGEASINASMEGGETGLAISKDHLLTNEIAGGPSRVRVFDLNGGHGETVKIPEISSISDLTPLPNGDVLYAVSSYLRPIYYARWSAASGQSAETALAVSSPIKFDDCEVVREFATSKDGAKVPLNIIRKKGAKAGAAGAALLYGYGGYGVSQTPAFLGAMRRLWLDAGGIYVVANIRGGGEYGEAWHTNGALTKKQNVFDDFYAAGRYLIDQKYTSPDKLALMGGSNGGLLMGAVMTQHPELARAIVSSVGIYDMLRVELDPNGEFNTTEFGTVKDQAQFNALYAYSPYHHVAKGTAYPAVLLLTGANDGRVNPLNSRKFAAALQAATGSDRPVLLRTSATSGHGIGSSLDERVSQQTDMLTFLFDQLGMSQPPSQ